VGLDPSRFEPFAGTVSPDTVATLTMELTVAGAPAVEMAGRVSGETWTLSHFVWGGEQQVQPGRTWTGRRAA
jgi:hypothetical protein